MANQRRLLMVGLGEQGRPYAGRAHARGLLLSVVDNPGNLADPEVQALWRDGDEVFAVAGSGDEAWFAAASEAVRIRRPDAVVAFSESHVMTAALIADELGLPGPGLRTAALSRNKALQRATFGRAGISQPAYHLTAAVDSALAWAYERYPVVLKPLDGAGSLGVRVAGDDSALRRWVAEGHASGPFLVEEYCDGPEYSCELLVRDGAVVFANVTAKQTTPPPLCVETGHRTPAGCDPSTEAAIVALATEVVLAAGMGSGIAHVEMRVGRSGPVLMEVGVRTPGDFIMEMTELATGVDLFDGVIALACGDAPAVTRTRGAAAAVWFPSFPAGMPLPGAALSLAAELPGVVRADIVTQPGELAAAVSWSLDRTIDFVVRGDDEVELEANLARVRATVELTSSTVD